MVGGGWVKSYLRSRIARRVRSRCDWCHTSLSLATLVRDVAVLCAHVRAASSRCPCVHTFQCRGLDRRSHNMLGARH